MAFQIKAENQRNTATVLISVPLRTRRTMEALARSEGTSLSAVGRRALDAYLADRVCSLARPEQEVPE